VNCTEKKRPSPQTQERATVFPQRRTFRKRNLGEEREGVAIKINIS